MGNHEFKEREQARLHEKLILWAFNGSLSEKTVDDKHEELMRALEEEFKSRKS